MIGVTICQSPLIAACFSSQLVGRPRRLPLFLVCSTSSYWACRHASTQVEEGARHLGARRMVGGSSTSTRALWAPIYCLHRPHALSRLEHRSRGDPERGRGGSGGGDSGLWSLSPTAPAPPHRAALTPLGCHHAERHDAADQFHVHEQLHNDLWKASPGSPLCFFNCFPFLFCIVTCRVVRVIVQVVFASVISRISFSISQVLHLFFAFITVVRFWS